MVWWAKIAFAARMMCLCVDDGSVVVLGLGQCAPCGSFVDALPTVSPCVDVFHVVPSHSRDSVERRFRKQCLVNRVDLVQLGGHVTNPEDPYTVVRDRGGKVRQDRLATVSDRTTWRAKMEESWRPTTLAMVMRNEKSPCHLLKCCGFGS